MAYNDELNTADLGKYGSDIITGVGANSGSWSVIEFVTSGAFSAFTGTGMSGTWTGVTFPAGFRIRGRITAFTLSSGTVVCYKAPPL